MTRYMLTTILAYAGLSLAAVLATGVKVGPAPPDVRPLVLATEGTARAPHADLSVRTAGALLAAGSGNRSPAA